MSLSNMTSDIQTAEVTYGTYPLRRRRVDNGYTDGYDLSAFAGDHEALVRLVLERAEEYVSSLLKSAESSGHRVLDIKLKWRNIPDANHNPLGNIGFVYCTGIAVDHGCPVPVDLSSLKGTEVVVPIIS